MKQPRYVVECEWSGPRSPAGQWTRLQHLEVITAKRAEALRKIHYIGFSDGTSLYVSVRECKPGERIKEQLGYGKLLEDAIRSGLGGCVHVDDLYKLSHATSETSHP